MIILAKQTGRARFNRLFKERMDGATPPSCQRLAPLAPPEMCIDFDHLEEGWLAPPEEHNLNQAAIAKLNELLQGGHDGS